jgi:CheY-like chemotaxis protein
MVTDRSILLVEDDPFFAALLLTRLQNEGFAVMHVRSGAEAIDAMRKHRFALVLLDLILPGRSGFEVLETIHSDPEVRKSPVMIVSHLGQGSDIQQARELGAVDYVVKSRMPIDDLVAKVNRFMNGDEQAEESH